MRVIEMRVIKTLVIGLGSTGTRICDAVANRIEWELQDLNRAPWVRFLCIETNENQESALHRTGDFQVIKISAEEYQEITQHPEHFDEKIDLTRWADMDTLKRLPGNEVSAGAGNIRMVGRLAFMYATNYNAIKYAITRRLRELRELTEAEATEKRGELSDGSNPTIEFAAGGEVRIFVAGTLCGGTCSGLIADFGYFLKTICTEAERVTGIFTLPRPDLAPAVEPKASRYKRNAYTSLLELNHYHLAERGNESPIRYADGIQPDTRQFPYDLPYLMVPRQPGPDYEHELNRATADRIFLSAFVPETDPFAQAVDATIFDREHRAHVFCAAGLSTVEFPAQQVIEACTKRLLGHALREWQNRPMEAHEETRRLDQIGLTWKHLLEALSQMEDVSLEQRLENQKEQILRLARSNLKACEDSLDQLRAAFHQQGGATEVNSALPPGLIPSTFSQNREVVAHVVLNKLRNLIQEKLLNYYDGPAPLQQLLGGAQKLLNDLRRGNPPSYDQHARNVDQQLHDLRQYHRSPLLRLFFLRGAAVDRLLPELRKSLEAEVVARVHYEAHRALQDQPVQAGFPEPGVLTRIQQLLQPVKKRIDSLMTRVTKLSNDLRKEADKLAREKPLINGICIFEPETQEGGTVRNEYQRCLFERANDPAADWQQVREREAARIIGTWEQLPGAVLPVRATNEEDWLLRDFNPNSSAEKSIPESQQEALEREASQPFLRLTEVDVLTRWRNNPVNGSDPVSKAREAARDAKPFLQVSRTLAERGGRSPVAVRRIVLTPRSPYQEEFLAAVHPAFGGEVNNGASPDNYRCIILEEWYRFPLSGVPAVLGEEGLHKAECTDFPNFHTRKDVFWVGISDREIEAIRKAEEIVAVGVLLDILEPRGGALVLSWQAGGFGGATERRLPLGIRGASHFLATASKDLRGNSLNGVLEALSNRIDHKRTSMSGSTHEQNKAFIQCLDEKLRGHAANVIPDWQTDRAVLLVTRYCARNKDLYRAYVEVFPPDPATVERLRRNAGDNKPRGGQYEERGLYCPECGGLVGTDEQDAARNGWRCYVNPDHYYGVDSHGN